LSRGCVSRVIWYFYLLAGASSLRVSGGLLFGCCAVAVWWQSGCCLVARCSLFCIAWLLFRLCFLAATRLLLLCCSASVGGCQLAAAWQFRFCLVAAWLLPSRCFVVASLGWLPFRCCSGALACAPEPCACVGLRWGLEGAGSRQGQRVWKCRGAVSDFAEPVLPKPWRARVCRLTTPSMNPLISFTPSFPTVSLSALSAASVSRCGRVACGGGGESVGGRGGDGNSGGVVGHGCCVRECASALGGVLRVRRLRAFFGGPKVGANFACKPWDA